MDPLRSDPALLTAEDSFLKCYTDAFSDAGAFHRAVSTAAAAATAAEKIPEYISKYVTEIGTAEIKATESACTAGAAFKCRMPELVILTPFLSIT